MQEVGKLVGHFKEMNANLDGCTVPEAPAAVCSRYQRSGSNYQWPQYRLSFSLKCRAQRRARVICKRIQLRSLWFQRHSKHGAPWAAVMGTVSERPTPKQEAGRDHTIPLLKVAMVGGVAGKVLQLWGDIKFQLICLPKQVKLKNVTLYEPLFKNKKKCKLSRGEVTWADLRMLQGPLCYM